MAQGFDPIAAANNIVNQAANSKYVPQWMRNAGGRLKTWGWSGVGHSALEGGASTFGIGRNNAVGPVQGSRWNFLGHQFGMPGMGKRMFGAGMALGVGYAAYAATDNPLMGIGIGLATSKAMGGGLGLKNMGGSLGLAFAAVDAVQGFKEGGVIGAAKSIGGSAIQFAAFEVGMKAVGTMTGMTMGSAAAVLLPAAAVVGLGYLTYKTNEYMAKRGVQSRQHEMVGSLAAFNTQGAFSMRERSMQSMQASHGSAMAALGPARSVLGNEASMVHF